MPADLDPRGRGRRRRVRRLGALGALAALLAGSAAALAAPGAALPAAAAPPIVTLPAAAPPIAALPAASTPAATPQRTALAVVVPLSAPARTTGLIPAEQLAALTAPGGGDLTRRLAAVTGTEATLAVDPLIAASAAALGEAAPASATAWLAALDASAAPRIDLAPADADPALLTAAGAPLPELELAWPATAGTTADSLAAFAAANARTILLPDADLTARSDPGSAAATVNGIPVLALDAAASAAVENAALHPGADAIAAARAAILSPGTRSSVVVALDRTGEQLPGLRQLLAALTADPAIELVGLDELAASATPTVSPSGAGAATAALGGASAPTERSGALRPVVAAEAADAAFAAITANPDAIRDDRRLRTEALASAAWLGDPGWQAALDEAVSNSSALRAGVRVAGADSLFLADRSSIPVSIANDLDQPVTVVVTARSSAGRLDIDSTPITVEVPAAARASVEFPATAVSNGNVEVTVTLTATDGTPIGAPAISTVNVQAGWETPIVAGAAGVLLVVIVVGVVRTVRRVRRARAGAR